MTRPPGGLILRCGETSRAVLMPARGGLLSELTLRGQDGKSVQVLWLPEQFSLEESGWPGGGMPLLFPFAGRQFHDGKPLSYALGGRSFHLPLHGFAYALPWAVSEQTEQMAELTLRSGPATHELFPFAFTLTARYTLTETGLELEIRVQNGGGRSDPLALMPLALGLHPYFFTPPEGGPYQLQTSATTMTRVTPTGTAGKSAPFLDEAGLAELTQPLYQSLILGNQKSPEATLQQGPQRLQLRWSPQFRYLVLWTQEGKPFHCVEPWMGLPDVLHNGEGLHWLPPGESLVLNCAMTLLP